MARERPWGGLLVALTLLGCGSAAVPGVHGGQGGQGGIDGSVDRPPSGTGGTGVDGSAATGGHGAAGAGGQGGTAGSGGSSAVDAAAGGSGGSAGTGTGGQGGLGGRGGTTGPVDAATDVGPSTGGRGGSGAGAGTGGSAGAGGTAGAGGSAGAGGAAGAACDPVQQTGCPTGDKCGIPPACTPAGAVGDGHICATTGFDDCASPDICIGDGTAHLCRQACNVGADCHQAAVASGTTAEPNNLGRCLITLGGSTIKVCTLACNPVTAAGPSGCASGYACIYFETTPVPELTDCEPAGLLAENADCSTADCAPGLVCVSTGTTHRCRQLCRTGNNADCAVAGDTCLMPTGVPNPMFGFCCAASGC